MVCSLVVTLKHAIAYVVGGIFRAGAKRARKRKHSPATQAEQENALKMQLETNVVQTNPRERDENSERRNCCLIATSQPKITALVNS